MADEMGRSRIVFWESDVGKLCIDTSYKVERVTVCMYQFVKYLSMSDRAVITGIGHFGEVADPPTEEAFPHVNQVVEGEIVGVASAEKYTSCKGKMKPITEVIGECSKCKMKVKLTRCETSSTACVLFCPVGGVPRKVTLFHKELVAITSDVTGT